MTKRKTVRDEFEEYWLLNIYQPYLRRRGLPASRWLERDDIWGKGGYAQPSVHNEWVAFKAGRRSKR